MKIVVVGGGIGGSLSALAFSRGCGLPTLLLEQFGGESGAGGGIGLWGNAQLGLQSIGVRVTGRLMESAGYKVGGKWLLAPTPFEQQKDGPSKVLRSCLCLERRELQDELLKELKREPLVEIERSAVTSVAKDGSAVILANGRVVEGIQLLVGADGLHSVVRRDVFPEIKAPTFSGYTYWRGICRSRGKERAFESWSPGKRFGVVPLSGDAAFWFCVSSTKMTREDLMREFPDMAPFIAESESIQETPIFDMERARRYDKGNTVLIGGLFCFAFVLHLVCICICFCFGFFICSFSFTMICQMQPM
jgi:2-polyprenyl-6-methoxyphenol hydroxylase-like FAD-dependent oxidoreductase